MEVIHRYDFCQDNEESVSIHPIVDETNIIWFKGVEIAKALDYKDPKRAIYQNVSDSDKVQYSTLKEMTNSSMNEHPYNVYINEYGLYELVLKSQLPKAKAFRKWITHEIIPSLRKTGEYRLLHKIEEKDKAIEEKDKAIEAKDKAIEAKDRAIDSMLVNMQRSNETMLSLTNKVVGIIPHIVPQTANKGKRNRLAIIIKNDNSSRPYCVIRRQECSMNGTIKKMKRKHPNMEVMINVEDPNSINTFNRIKEMLCMECDQHNNFNSPLSKEELIEAIKKIQSNKNFI